MLSQKTLEGHGFDGSGCAAGAGPVPGLRGRGGFVLALAWPVLVPKEADLEQRLDIVKGVKSGLVKRLHRKHL